MIRWQALRHQSGSLGIVNVAGFGNWNLCCFACGAGWPGKAPRTGSSDEETCSDHRHRQLERIIGYRYAHLSLTGDCSRQFKARKLQAG